MSSVLGQERAEVGARPVVSGPPAVLAQNVSKSFRLPHEQLHTLKERFVHPFRKRSHDVLRAVQDVSFEVAPGEFFGIVGRNGSGKSTLLKCLAGIYISDAGQLHIEGRLSPFIELGVGFNPELTARDNVIINAIMLGLTRKQARERFGDIIAFAELEEFVDLKLKNFSSGMYVRLAFATAVQVDADVLLIDEVLAVGDAAFQQKCFDEFTRLREEGRTILFVTHDMAAVERFCHRAMLLERGRVVEIGDPSLVARKYNQMNFSQIRAEREQDGEGEREAVRESSGGRGVELLNAFFEGEAGEPALTANQGESLTVRADVRFAEEITDPIFAVSLQNESGNFAFVTSTETQHMTTGRFPAGSRATVRMSFDNRLAPGRYKLFVTVARSGLGADVLDAHVTNSIMILPDRPGGGIVDLPHTFDISRN